MKMKQSDWGRFSQRAVFLHPARCEMQPARCEIQPNLCEKLKINKQKLSFKKYLIIFRAVARELIGGCIFIYSCYARLISSEINLKTTDFKRNPSCITRIYICYLPAARSG